MMTLSTVTVIAIALAHLFLFPIRRLYKDHVQECAINHHVSPLSYLFFNSSPREQMIRLSIRFENSASPTTNYHSEHTLTLSRDVSHLYGLRNMKTNYPRKVG